MAKHLFKFRGAYEANSRRLKALKLEADEKRISVNDKRLEIADKVMDVISDIDPAEYIPKFD